MTLEKKKWYKSKTKVGTILIGLGPILATVGGMLTGSVDFVSGITALSVEMGVVFAAFGIRDLPFVNKR